jgi:hypothetical protein
MRAFEVSLNGKRVCTAGLGDDAVLNVIANHLTGQGRAETHFNVGGLDCTANEFVDWEFMRKLKRGDKLLIRVVDSDSIDKPRRRKPRDPAEELRQTKLYVRRMAKQFGWKIVAANKPK